MSRAHQFVSHSEPKPHLLGYAHHVGRVVEVLPGQPVRCPAADGLESLVDLSALYSVHDGLVHFYSYDGGPLPYAEWRALTGPDESDPSLVVIAQEGPRAFGFDVSQDPVRAYHMDPEEDDVTLVTDPWAFLDDMTALEWLDG